MADPFSEDSRIFSAQVLLPCMASDEIEALARATSPADCVQLTHIFRQRRAWLDDVSRRRLDGLAWDPAAIQVTLDHAGASARFPLFDAFADLSAHHCRRHG